jgi:hypothetical protein
MEFDYHYIFLAFPWTGTELSFWRRRWFALLIFHRHFLNILNSIHWHKPDNQECICSCIPCQKKGCPRWCLDSRAGACSFHWSCSTRVDQVPSSGCLRLARSLLLRTSRTTPCNPAPRLSSGLGFLATMLCRFFSIRNWKDVM